MYERPLFPDGERGTTLEVIFEVLTAVLDQVDPMVPYDEACSLLSCGPYRLADLLKSGQLPGLKIGREWVVPRRAFFERVNEMAVNGSLARMRQREREEAARPLPNPQVGERPRGRPRMKAPA